MSDKKINNLKIDDYSEDSDNTEVSVYWNEDDEIFEEKKSSKMKKINSIESISTMNDSQDDVMESSNEINDKNRPEVNIEVVKNKNGESSVQISLIMKLENKNDIVNINFNINKATFLKLAKELE
jgi:hypothetical protein